MTNGPTRQEIAEAIYRCHEPLQGIYALSERAADAVLDLLGRTQPEPGDEDRCKCGHEYGWHTTGLGYCARIASASNDVCGCDDFERIEPLPVAATPEPEPDPSGHAPIGFDHVAGRPFDCRVCGNGWPCPTRQMEDAFDADRRAKAAAELTPDRPAPPSSITVEVPRSLVIGLACRQRPAATLGLLDALLDLVLSAPEPPAASGAPSPDRPTWWCGDPECAGPPAAAASPEPERPMLPAKVQYRVGRNGAEAGMDYPPFDDLTEAVEFATRPTNRWPLKVWRVTMASARWDEITDLTAAASGAPSPDRPAGEYDPERPSRDQVAEAAYFARWGTDLPTDPRGVTRGLWLTIADAVIALFDGRAAGAPSPDPQPADEIAVVITRELAEWWTDPARMFSPGGAFDDVRAACRVALGEASR